jgi:hypothetical protein
MTASTRVAVIGDVGGSVDHLAHCLDSLGITDTTWPDGLHVVQLGDLLGGREDDACVELARPHLAAGRWTQMIGNWEQSAIGVESARSTSGRTVDPAAIKMLRGINRQHGLFVAVVVRGGDGIDRLITHAGLTAGFWTAFGAPTDAIETALILNALPAERAAVPGVMIMGKPTLTAGPLWANVNELWLSWIQAPGAVPFPLIHGHTSAWDNDRQRWSRLASPRLLEHASVEPRHRSRHIHCIARCAPDHRDRLQSLGSVEA